MGAKPLALVATEAVCANTAVDELTIPVKEAPLPENDPLKVPLTNKLPVKALLPDTLKASVELPVTNNEPEI